MRAKLAGVCLIAAALALWPRRCPRRTGPRRRSPTSVRRATSGPPAWSSSAPARSPTRTTARTRSPWWSTFRRWTPRRSPLASTWEPPRWTPSGSRAWLAPTGATWRGSRCGWPASSPTRSSRRTEDLNLVFERPATAAAPESRTTRTGGGARHGAGSAAPGRPRHRSRRRPRPPPSRGQRAAPMEARRASSGLAGLRATRIVAVARESGGDLPAFTVRADGRLKYQDFTLPGPDRLVIDFAGRGGQRELPPDRGERGSGRARAASGSSAPPRRRWRAWWWTSPTRPRTGSSRARTTSASSLVRRASRQPPAHAPLAALRSPGAGAGRRSRSPWPDRADPVAEASRSRWPSSRCRCRRCRSRRCPTRCPATCRRCPETTRWAPPAVRPEISARPSASTSRTATCRTSSGSSPTSRA